MFCDWGFSPFRFLARECCTGRVVWVIDWPEASKMSRCLLQAGDCGTWAWNANHQLRKTRLSYLNSHELLGVLQWKFQDWMIIDEQTCHPKLSMPSFEDWKPKGFILSKSCKNAIASWDEALGYSALLQVCCCEAGKTASRRPTMSQGDLWNKRLWLWSTGYQWVVCFLFTSFQACIVYSCTLSMYKSYYWSILVPLAISQVPFAIIQLLMNHTNNIVFTRLRLEVTAQTDGCMALMGSY